MDQIRIENLEVFANHGVMKEENALGQKFLVSAVLYTDTERAGFTDDLKESVHYGEVCHFITKFMKDNTYKLIEAAAERLAAALLIHFCNLREIRLEIKKPWAPIGLPLENVSICIRRKWHRVYLAMGSNMGDRERYIRKAVERIGEDEECTVKKVSDLICTKPYGYTQQDDFVNGAMEIETLKSPVRLLDFLHEIEAEADRKREIHWGPRTLDLDILLYDDERIDSESLTIPHADMCNRAFVLKPLMQIAPYARHPVNGKTAAELWRCLEEGGCSY
ncbi:2-amino-4-hydroxy-6-hydroxymethyldihydropteridine diphosphokinase [bacterium C-53]|nr:2-amino-4-hydroxy-6-hydroxymethyldihydropteridine diphosphokinase [Lachnospiraceae bacterium]NBI03969.1 2-amino-4-hydroxy-6-hydroxymethyldihydropteridine diphosphokinase [Lachnospiraceae bacterium]RKJ08907.1 2-amino-4-hydroxy-6-hydroxymethyldihydropteridine diphosphokinase [bacterium C-53]